MASRTIDVSTLPDTAWDTRDPLWWGNTLLMCIETTTVALMVATYFYLKRNFENWPPPHPDVMQFDPRPLPFLKVGSWNCALIVLSIIPMIFTDIAARKLNQPAVIIGLAIMLGVCLGTTIIRFYEFPAMRFRWSDNAYASTVWTTLGLHLTYLLGGLFECLIMLVWMLTHPINQKRALDVTLVAIYWYWVIAVEILIYCMIYWVPRWTT